MKRKFHIGDILIVPAERTNPYVGYSEAGEMRALHLRQFRDGELDPAWRAWYAPSFGGARLVAAHEVDWLQSGLKAKP